MGLKHWLGLQSVKRTITDHAPRIVTPDPGSNPLQRFKASLPEGALDAPVAAWPREQLAGYIAATCAYARSAFFTEDDWAIRSASALANLMFDANLPQLAVAYNFEGTREGVAQEVGTFRMTAHDRTTWESPIRPSETTDAAAGQTPDTAVAADPEAPTPKPHLAPLWADQPGVLALYDEVANVLLERPHADPVTSARTAVTATAYALNVLDYLSSQNLAVYDQTMRGLSKQSDTDRETIERRRGMAYDMATTRTEIALPEPTSVPKSTSQRPM